MTAWLRRAFLLPPNREDHLEDRAVAALWAAGTLGVQSLPQADGRLLLEAFFPAEPAPAPLELDLPGVEPAGEGAVAEEDWFAGWRERVRPFPVASSLFVDPREPADAERDRVETPDGRRRLILPARAAFGTGSHESTALALELLEALDLAGRRVLDVGTGTGVLAFAALLFGAARAVGFDSDLTAPFHARDNGFLNRLAPALFAGPTAALREGPAFDLALVNVVPEQILPEMPAILRRLAPGGELILSGILIERGRMVLDRLRGLGYRERERREAGDWVAFRVGAGS